MAQVNRRVSDCDAPELLWGGWKSQPRLPCGDDFGVFHHGGVVGLGAGPQTKEGMLRTK
ncbi:hypothetical protein [Paenibacillus macquariensis]|uniref:hypothetical protein n=1 Tax=Paenibacillus macquariensis TaxID=948756 RepID=UPI0012E76C73|nr:hypothetical protein [Paenibacillus macquariensis]MEC0090156.1 hypothetical protein [Paenibacillus macquariensis]